MPAPPTRFDLLDALRGFAVVLMMAFHFSFDLSMFGYVRIDFYQDPFWLNARIFIVTLFVGVAGASLSLATRDGIHWQRFLRREAILLACALLVSAGSYAMFPQSWIFFGILHFMALAGLLAVPFLHFGISNLVVGVLILLASWLFTHPLFDAPALQWLGFMTHKPITEDYAPLVPWFGVLLLGIFIGKQLPNSNLFQYPLHTQRWAKPLLWLGRHSLLVYMLHQPIFILLLVLLAL
ncbi:MAG: heparan-alpha-glucosaminide N-acetyltransferase [Thiothrix sp.]|uniref:heparan-alpha-glucosaminide N-acetyltransferase n=1 Tax=Thiothrix sp. TaxID=1032 RepID=UPI00261C65B6|nr:heparan-alpha-glucosaminide N-acetyltransferase [Thiothrix sp.]MDD5392716.1 heparan-alpha-glucosaminide N-acetyltransferase [Thiothrix sp.]